MGKKKILRVTEERKASVDHQSEHGLDQDQNLPKFVANKATRHIRKNAVRGCSGNLSNKETPEVIHQNAKLLSDACTLKIRKFQEFYQQYLQVKINQNDEQRIQEYERAKRNLLKRIKKACWKVFRQEAVSVLAQFSQKTEIMKEQLKKIELDEAKICSPKPSNNVHSTDSIEQLQDLRTKKYALIHKIKETGQLYAKARKMIDEEPEIDDD